MPAGVDLERGADFEDRRPPPGRSSLGRSPLQLSSAPPDSGAGFRILWPTSDRAEYPPSRHTATSSYNFRVLAGNRHSHSAKSNREGISDSSQMHRSRPGLRP